MIIYPIDLPCTYPSPAELHGFPPWHIRLTEILFVLSFFHDSFSDLLCSLKEPRIGMLHSLFTWRTLSIPLSLDEDTFREALDEFASAEMRFGK